MHFPTFFSWRPSSLPSLVASHWAVYFKTMFLFNFSSLKVWNRIIITKTYAFYNKTVNPISDSIFITTETHLRVSDHISFLYTFKSIHKMRKNDITMGVGSPPPPSPLLQIRNRVNCFTLYRQLCGDTFPQEEGNLK